MTIEEVELLVAQARNEADNPAYKVCEPLTDLIAALGAGGGQVFRPIRRRASTDFGGLANRLTFQCESRWPLFKGGSGDSWQKVWKLTRAQ